ncbi:MAG: hypothetical protein GEU92_03780 [Alphaproteobacteria bacterium]|nr:hypothetical protein [Alphaproteobacteria bacterium]
MILPTVAEIRRANAAVDDNGYLLLTATRPVGPYLAWLWMRLGMTPRQVNYMSIVLAAVILWLAAAGGAAGLVWATGLCFAWQAVDVSDGTMARALRIRDNFGGFVDYSCGMLIVAFLPLCLGIGACLAPDGSLGGAFRAFGLAPPPPVAVLAMGAGIAVISLYMRLINRVLQIRFGDSLSEPDKTGGGAGAMRLAREVLKNLETIGGVQAIAFFASAVAGMIELAIALYFVLYCLIFVAFAASVYRNYGNRRAYL